MKNPNVVKAKEQASRVVARLGALGFDVKHGQALEVVAAVFGAENWHAYAAQLKKPEAAAAAVNTAAAEAPAYKWIEVTLLAGAGNFRAQALRLSTSLEDAIARVKATCWTPAIASLYPDGVVALTKVVAPMSDVVDVKLWLQKCGIEEADLDSAVHEAVQGAALTRLNSIGDEGLQEDHIAARETEASEINNSGMEAQLDYLRDGFDDIPSFVSYLLDELDLSDQYHV